MAKGKICPVSLGLAFGVTWGVGMLVMGLLAHFYMYGKPFVEAMGQLYLGYDASYKGIIIGGLLGFVDAFIASFIIGWLYNFFSGCRCKKDDSSE